MIRIFLFVMEADAGYLVSSTRALVGLQVVLTVIALASSTLLGDQKSTCAHLLTVYSICLQGPTDSDSYCEGLGVSAFQQHCAHGPQVAGKDFGDMKIPALMVLHYSNAALETR